MILKWVEKVQLTIGVAFFSTFIIAIFIQVFSRYLSISVIWSEEVANYSFIWSVFMGASVMLRHKEHFKFTLLLEKLKGRQKVYLDMLINSILLLFNLAILLYGIDTVQNFWNYRWVSLPALRMGYVWLCVPTMGLTMSLYSIEHLIDNVKELKQKGVYE